MLNCNSEYKYLLTMIVFIFYFLLKFYYFPMLEKTTEIFIIFGGFLWPPKIENIIFSGFYR
jgi:hypothetical protein